MPETSERLVATRPTLPSPVARTATSSVRGGCSASTDSLIVRCIVRSGRCDMDRDVFSGRGGVARIERTGSSGHRLRRWLVLLVLLLLRRTKSHRSVTHRAAVWNRDSKSSQRLSTELQGDLTEYDPRFTALGSGHIQTSSPEKQPATIRPRREME